MTQRRILVVDDEPFICRSLSFVLRKSDYLVFEARNGEEAIAAIREHKPDLVFLDVMMPKLNGFQVTEEVRRDRALDTVKIVLLTAKGQECDRDQGKAVGATDYITKPFSPTKILERVKQLLES
jgi:DNA-binding response OmpR family regulator